jgi:hypothetical protein
MAKYRPSLGRAAAYDQSGYDRASAIVVAQLTHNPSLSSYYA